MTDRERLVYQVRVTLVDSDPQIWRRIRLSGEATLEDLHLILQVVMDWEDYHLHRFAAGEKTYGVDEDFMPDPESERSSALHQVAPNPGDRIFYEYDFGDGWEHDLLIEETVQPERGVRYPVCLGGGCAAPPEDCGGVFGFYAMLEAYEDEKHPDHEEVLAWLGGDYDPIAFDLDRINRNLRAPR